MASTYSTNLKIELIGTGEQAGTWGTTTNTNLGTALEQAVVGKADVTMSSTTITLTLTNANTAQNARAIYLNLTGSPGGAAVLEVPAIQKPYIVKNGSDQQVTIKVSGQTGVAIPTGKTALVYNNGTDVVTAVDFIPEIATTTVDATNIEVTNIKAKDGTSAGSIADSTGVVTLASSVLTTTDINGGTIDGAVIGGASADAGSFTTLNTSGAVVFNDAGADVDFRVEGDTDANLLFVDASTDRVGVGTSTPGDKLDIRGGGLQVQQGASNSANFSITTSSTPSSGTTLNASWSGAGSQGPLIFDLGGTEAMRLDASGNVMIGNTVGASFDAISKTLSVGSGSGSQGITVYSGTASTGSVVFADGTSGTDAYQGIIQYEHTNNELLFYVNYAGSSAPRMTIDSSGNVGIGTSSPISAGGQTSVTINGTSVARSDYFISGTHTASFTTQAGGTNIATKTSSSLEFSTNDTERMRIDSSGNLLVGTTSNSTYPSRGYFVGNATYGGLSVSAPGDGLGYPVYFVDSNATSASQQIVHFDRGSSTVGFITTTNTTTTYSSASDYRLKNTIAPITGALSKVALLKPCTYKWNIDGSEGQGFIAHELQEVCPIAVYGTKDAIDANGNPEYQGVDTSFLVATLTAAIQEQQAIIESLKARLDAANL
jgi:hypothetical protein